MKLFKKIKRMFTHKKVRWTKYWKGKDGKIRSHERTTYRRRRK